MATQHLAVTADPADLIAALALADGGDYLVQAVGRGVVRLAEGAAAPADRDAAHAVIPGAVWALTVGADPLWVWCADPGGAALAVTEAA